MTANRWWVRLAARWLARIDGIKGQIQSFSLAVTAFSTFSIMLQGFNLGHLVPYFGGVAVVGGVVYTYYYTEGGVWNQVARDRQDLSQNFAGPGIYIKSMVLTQAIAESLEAMENGEDPTEAAHEAVEQHWRDMRDGIEI